MPLDKAGCGSAETDDQIKRATLGIESAKVLDERELRVWIAEAGRYKRMVMDVERPWRLAIQFDTDRLGVFSKA
jgi:hypothetical protein